MLATATVSTSVSVRSKYLSMSNMIIYILYEYIYTYNIYIDLVATAWYRNLADIFSRQRPTFLRSPKPQFAPTFEARQNTH